MTEASARQRQFYVAHLRNERKRQSSAFEAKFGLDPTGYRWVDPEVNLDYFEPNAYSAARPRILPPGLLEVTCRDWSGLTALARSLWEGRDTVRLLLDSSRSVGAIEVDAGRARDLFRHLLSVDQDAVVAATPDWAAWALFDVHSLGPADFRVDAALRGEWANRGQVV